MLAYVIEGCDGSGKETVSHILVKQIYARYKELTGKECTINHCSFPDYTIPTGAAITEFLSKETRYTDLSNQYATSLLFSKNRQEYFKLHPECDDFIFSIFDRYMHSNLIYQSLGLSDKEALQLYEMLKEVEYNVYKNPIARQVFFLQVPLEVLLQRVASRKDMKCGASVDYNESREMMIKIYNNALRIVQLLPEEFTPINTCENERFLTPNEIANKIMAKIILF